MRWHVAPLSVGDVIRYGDALVTTPTRTVVDLALALPFREAVAIVDGALHRRLTSHDALVGHLDGRPKARSGASARRAIAFGNAGSASAGESLSRVSIAEGHLPVPTLQKAFTDYDGAIGYVDFWWEDAGVIGEFDGVKKYLQAEFRGGRTTENVLLAEKRRADRLVAVPGVRRLVRWGWREAQDPALLAQAGVTPRRG